MKILYAHNYYQQPGGEDQSFAAEVAMLESHGHEVLQHHVHNDAINQMSRLGVAARTFWNHASYRKLRQLIRRHQPDVAHFNNTFPLISPAGYYAARAEGVPVVQTLRNFRLLCPAALFFRDHQVCESCLGKAIPFPAIQHKCYRGSRSATATVAGMLTLHRLLGTWRNVVDAYVVLTEFSRRKFIEGGLPADKLFVKPNFVTPDPGVGRGAGGYALFVGRLSAEKGLNTLLAAWAALPGDVCLKIAGDGPLAPLVQAAADKDPRIQWLGRQSSAQVYALVAEAALLAMPSLWYEGLPRTIIEAFAAGTPVVASDLGAMSELVDHGRTGLKFPPGDTHQLAANLQRLLLSEPQLAQTMRQEARGDFERYFAEEPNYHLTKKIYQHVLAARGKSLPELDECLAPN